MDLSRLEISSPPLPPPQNSPAKLADLPDSVLYNILTILVFARPISSPSPLSLRGRSLVRAYDAHALALVHRRFRQIFRTSVAHLHLEWDDIVGDGVAAFFPSLKSLVINRHANSLSLIAPLNQPTLQKLHLIRVPADYPALARTLLILAPSLQDFALHSAHTAAGAAANFLPVTDALASCPALTHLSLHDIHDLGREHLTRLILLTPNIRTLSLGHQSLDCATLTAIARTSRLDTLRLHNLPSPSAPAVAETCAAIGARLRALALHNVATLCDAHLATITAACPRLLSLALRSDEAGRISAASVVAATAALAPNLLALEVEGAAAVDVGDEDLRQIMQHAPAMQVLCLRHAAVTDDGLEAAAETLAGSLRVIDVGGRMISDRGLAALGACTKLESFSVTIVPATELGGMVVYVPPPAAGGGDRRPVAVSNAGIEELVRGCGKRLTRFQIVNLLAMDFPYRRQENLGARLMPPLACAGVYLSLSQHCSSRLQVVSLQKMVPPLSARRERMQMNVMKEAMEQACPQSVVWADREAPPFLALSVDDLLSGSNTV